MREILQRGFLNTSLTKKGDSHSSLSLIIKDVGVVEGRSSILDDVELRKTKGKRELLNLERSINYGIASASAWRRKGKTMVS